MGLGKITIATATNKVSLHTGWTNVGTITATEVIGTDRTVATVEAKTSTKFALLEPVEVPYAYLFRFRSDGDLSDDSKLRLFVSRGTDYYFWLAHIDLNRGAILHSGDIYFVDTITPNSENLIFDPEEDSQGECASYYIRTLGYSKFLFLGNSLGGNITTVYVDVAYLYE